MSLGPGVIQRGIIDFLSTQPGATGFFHEAQWHVARRENGLQTSKAAHGGKEIKPSFASSFHRAMRGLRDKSTVKPTMGHILGFSDLSRYYPFRTTSEPVLDMRQKLLPFCESFVRSEYFIKFSTAENEVHVVSKLSDGQRLRLQQEWLVIQGVLVDAMGRCNAQERMALVEAIARGQRLFEPGSMLDNRVSLRSVLKRLCDVLSESDSAVQALTSFSQHVFPDSAYQRMRLKTQLYGVVDLRSARLQRDFKLYLIRFAKGHLQQLHGHVDGVPPKELLSFRESMRPKMIFSPLLEQLVLRDALRACQFYTLI